jgi:hypothetical protein
MRRFRALLLICISVAFCGQPLANSMCACDLHSEGAAMPSSDSGSDEHSHHLVEDMADHGASMNDSSESDDCNPSGMQVCACHACAHFVGLLFEYTHAVTVVAARDHAALPHYAEPPRRQAFRPPIPI